MMKEIAEFRIPEKHASRLLGPNEGKRLGTSVRAFKIPVDDARYEQIGGLNRQLRKENEFFFAGWNIERHYSREELAAAKLFTLFITAVFEPVGEQCGTVYDNSTACPLCGAGRTQRSDLVLDLRRVPKAKEIARTIADEWIVSQRLAQLLVDAKMTGFELRPVRHKAYYREDPIDFARVPTGREILRRADEAGLSTETWDYIVWLNRPEQKLLAEQATEEYVQMMERRDLCRPKALPVWHQLVVTSPAVRMVPPTRFGIHPFDEDPEGRCSCPLGHVAGLNLLSELWILRTTADESDIAQTENQVGCRRGVLVPSPLLLISPRMWRLLKTEKVKGYEMEIAHLV